MPVQAEVGLLCTGRRYNYNALARNNEYFKPVFKEFAVVLRCDATGAAEPSECSYLEKIGTKYTTETSEHMSFSAGVYAEIQASVFGNMAKMGISAKTGYDWTKTSAVTMDKEESFQVKATAPPGKVLHIEQAVGQCGGNKAQTEMFRIRHTSGETGEVLSVRHERHLRNGEIHPVDDQREFN